jgi:mono/diheme cytochrome c family protein
VNGDVAKDAMMPCSSKSPVLLLFQSPRSRDAAQAQAGNATKQKSKGQQISLQKCMVCHSVNKNQVMLGPSLWNEMSRSPHNKTAAQIRVLLREGKGKNAPDEGSPHTRADR